MIKPTVGRVVLFTPAHADKGVIKHGLDPLAALIVCVWNDRCINIAFFDANGIASNATSVPLLQDDDLKPETGFFCSWMEYQKGQAAKTESLEAKLEGKA